MSQLSAVHPPSISSPTSLSALGRHLAGPLIWAYAALVPLLVVPIGGERIGLCEPLLIPCGLVLLIAIPHSRPRLPHLAMAIFLSAALLSLFQIDDADQFIGSAKRWVRLLAVVAPFYLSLIVPADKPQFDRIVRAFLAGGGVAIFAGLIVYWLQIPIHQDSQKLWLKHGQAPVLRASGLVGDTASFGHLVSLWCLTAIGQLYLTRSPYRLAASIAILTLVLYVVLISSSRAALLNIAGGIFTLWLLIKVRPRALGNQAMLAVTGALIGIALLLAVFCLSGSGEHRTGVLAGSLDRFLGSGDSSVNSFASGRVDGWAALLFDHAEYLLLGTGYKTAQYVIPGHFADNALLAVALETGLLGLASILFFLLAVVWGLIAQHRSGNRCGTLLLAVWVGQFIHGLTADTLTLWTTMPVLYLFTGFVLQMSASVEQDAKVPVAGRDYSWKVS